MNKLFGIIMGAIVAILGATGLVNQEEGAGLQEYGTSAVEGAIGLVQVIRELVKRKKDEKKDKEQK